MFCAGLERNSPGLEFIGGAHMQRITLPLNAEVKLLKHVRQLGPYLLYLYLLHKSFGFKNRAHRWQA